jgi:hypothetical protein
MSTQIINQSQFKAQDDFRPHNAQELIESIYDARNSKGYDSVKALMEDLKS